MKLGKPSAPFSQVKVIGESITVDTSFSYLVIPTGHSYLLPLYNEFTLSRDELSVGSYSLTDSLNSSDSLKNMMYPWIAGYDPSTSEIDFFLFTERPKQLQFTVETITDEGAFLTSSGDNYLTSDGNYFLWYDPENKITSMTLYPRNGILYHGQIVNPLLSTDSNTTLIPDAIHKSIEGSLMSFLENYGCEEGNIGSEQYLLNDDSEFLSSTSDYVFSEKLTGANTTILVNENSIIQLIPLDFAGLTLDMSSVFDFITNVQTYPKYLQLLQNLGQSNIRIQGGDYTVWDAEGTSSESPTRTINRDIVDSLYTIFHGLGWTVGWMVNLANYNPSLYADEANYVYSKFGTDLVGIEIGNEPDNYVTLGIRAVGYNYSQYITQWQAYADAIKALNANIPLTGPSAYISSWLSSFSPVSDSEYLNAHLYPLYARLNPTLTQLLGKSVMTDIETLIQTWLGYSADLVIGETNAVADGGTTGVSNSLGAALWGLDYMFTALNMGVKRINFQGAFLDGSFYYQPIMADGTPQALYYAMLLFHEAAATGSTVTTTVSTSFNLKSYSALGTDGKLHVVIINKDFYNDAIVQLETTNPYIEASVMYLKGHGLASTSVFSLGGNPVASDGTWTPNYQSLLLSSTNKTTLTVPVGSAATVTFE